MPKKQPHAVRVWGKTRTGETLEKYFIGHPYYSIPVDLGRWIDAHDIVEWDYLPVDEKTAKLSR